MAHNSSSNNRHTKIYKFNEGAKMSIFNRDKSKSLALVSMKEKYNLTENVKVADVKQYLLDEYNRAYTRENTINKLENKIIELEEVKIKYDAMLVVSEKTRERLIKSEETVTHLKSTIAEQRDTIKTLKNTNNNIELNYSHKLKEKDEQIKSLKKLSKTTAKK